MSLRDFADFLKGEIPRGRVVEIGIGFRFDVALRLRDLGYDVLAVDWNPESVRKAEELGIRAVRDDVFNPRVKLYGNPRGIYSIRPTPETVPAILKLGVMLGAPVYILPLSGDTMPRRMRLVNYRGLAVYTTKHI